MSTQQPTVGRIVHFHAGHIIDGDGFTSQYPPEQPLAAIITEVRPRISEDTWYSMADGEELPQPDMIVRLDVRYPGVQDPWPLYGPYYPYSETPKPGHWSWPPRA